MGVLSQMMREIAGGRPGVITKTGLHTSLIRAAGGRQSAKTKDNVVEVSSLTRGVAALQAVQDRCCDLKGNYR